MTDNKPCPFCGDTDISYIPAVLGVISQAYCESCHARGPQTSDSDHFDLWNTRHTPWRTMDKLTTKHGRILALTSSGVRIGKRVITEGWVIPLWEVETAVGETPSKDTMPLGWMPLP
jgi:Lar family restriction alleviation protein